MAFFEEIVVGQRLELGSFTFTAELIKKFASQFDRELTTSLPFRLDPCAIQSRVDIEPEDHVVE